MFVEDKEGNLVNLNDAMHIVIWQSRVESYGSEDMRVLYDGSNPIKYLEELKKELAAFGKLIQVKMD